MDYQKFKKEFEESGKTQKSFGVEKSMSSSMVHYYLRKAEEEARQKEREPSFTKISIQESKVQSIKIVTRTGLQITIPI